MPSGMNPARLYRTTSSASAGAISPVKKRQALVRLLTTAPDLERGSGGVLRYYTGLVTAAGALVKTYHTECHVLEPAGRWADDFLRSHGVDRTLPLVAVHPGATGPYKIWPPERFAALIDRLQTAGLARVMLCGSDFDREVVRRVKEHLLRFSQLYGMLKNRCIGEEWLSVVEGKDNLFPNLDYRVYCSGAVDLAGVTYAGRELRTDA